MAFLLWNFYPAKLRPGAVGMPVFSRCAGLCAAERRLARADAPAGSAYWLEGGMVALQIIVWKASGGRRQLFGTAPLHRWLESGL